MKVSQIDRCAEEAALSLPGLSPSWVFSHNVASKACRTLGGRVNLARLQSWLFCLCLWFSSLLVIFMSPGWLAPFISGQVLFTGSWLFERLVRKTWATLSSPAETVKGLNGAFDEL